MKITTAEMLCVGTELLLGEVVNTNVAYMGRVLSSLGISVYRTSVVGDNAERLREEFLSAYNRADLVITSGGLGPTYDDLTKETVASALGLDMVRDESVLSDIETYFTKTGRSMTENNKKQADVPRGARVLKNPIGTAPGILIEKNEKLVIMLPGPPSELCPMVESQVRPLLAAMSDKTIVSRNVHIMGMGESAVETELYELMKNGCNPAIAPYAKEGEVRLRVSAMADSFDQGAAMCDEVVEKIKNSRVGEYIYGIDAVNIESALVSALKERGLTFSCAESCTGGLLAKRITDVAGASSVFRGSFVTYSNEAKIKMIGVSSETLATYGAVSAQTAREMARGARLAMESDIAVSLTGSAGPEKDPSSDEPVGTVYIGISTLEGEYAERISLSDQRSRDYIRFVASSRAMREILKNIKK